MSISLAVGPTAAVQTAGLAGHRSALGAVVELPKLAVGAVAAAELLAAGVDPIPVASVEGPAQAAPNPVARAVVEVLEVVAHPSHAAAVAGFGAVEP